MKNFNALLLQQYSNKITKDIALKSRWSQLSNRVEGRAMPVADEMQVPKDVIHYVSSKQKRGDYSVTIPLIEALREDGTGGSIPAKGTEESPNSKSCKSYYNDVRKAIRLEDNSAEYDAISYLNLGGQASQLLSDWFMADDDYSHQRALCLGADRYLTEAEYWAKNKAVTTPPVSVTHHPNIAYRGLTTEITRSSTLATDQGNINTALANMSASTVFDLAAVHSLARFASRFVAPLGWNYGGHVVNWIVLISEYQADQLRSDSTWQTLMQNADDRGDKNRAISGALKPYRGLLLVEDQFSPIWHLSTSKIGATGYEFVTPTGANTVSGIAGIGALNRVVKGAATVATGTCEVARVLGRGAIAVPEIQGMKLVNDSDDYGFFTGICAHKKQGHCRLDFYDGAQNFATRKNIGSGLFFTATPAIQY